VLRRLKLNRIRHIEPQLPPNRYEHAAPGDLLHLDVKRLVRIQRPSHRVTGDRRDGVKGIGAEFLHVAIDDHSRLAFTAMYPDQTERSSTHFLAAAVAWYERLGIGIRRVFTDNGPCYKAHRFAYACGQLGLKHRRTRPYTPRTNGKAERFIKTAINEWAYAYTLHLPELRRPKQSHSQPGLTSTTGIGRTPVSINNRPSAEQESMTTTS
jgi:transposase InsO family protein